MKINETSPNLDPRPVFGLAEAKALAIEFHADQMSKSGKSLYIEHPLRIAEALEPYGEKVQIIGALHDTIEDTKLTPQELKNRGASQETIEDVLILTKKDGENYDDLLRRAKSKRRTSLVKLADNLDNGNEERLARLTPEHATSARQKYLRARAVLTEGDPWLVEQIPVVQARIQSLYRQDKAT